MIDQQQYSIILLSLLIPQYLSSCIPSATQCGCSQIQPIFTQSKIVGGYVARNNSWPWIVSFRRVKHSDNTPTNPGFSFCMGALLNSKYILTAAHCFNTVNPSRLSEYFAVIGGVFINDTNNRRFTIKSITVHSDYDSETSRNDIALIELRDSVDFNNTAYGFICLPLHYPTTYPDEPLIGTAVGWGLLQQGGSASYTLQQVELPIISDSNQYCSTAIADDSLQFCAGYIQGGKDTCQGDSGGPFMILDAASNTWDVAGITSYGDGCAAPNSPGSRASMKSVAFIIISFFL